MNIVPPRHKEAVRKTGGKVRHAMDRLRYGVLAAMLFAAGGVSFERHFLGGAFFQTPENKPSLSERRAPMAPRRRPVVPAEFGFPYASLFVPVLDPRRQASCLSASAVVVRRGIGAPAAAAEDVCLRGSQVSTRPG